MCRSSCQLSESLLIFFGIGYFYLQGTRSESELTAFRQFQELNWRALINIIYVSPEVCHGEYSPATVDEYHVRGICLGCMCIYHARCLGYRRRLVGRPPCNDVGGQNQVALIHYATHKLIHN
jgi:hypothetical protein